MTKYSRGLAKYIPPGFDLSNYKEAANMELIDWGRNLSRKHFLLEQVSSEWAPEDLEERIIHSISCGVTFDGFPTKEDIEYIANSQWIDFITVVRDLRASEIKDRAHELRELDPSKDMLAMESENTNDYNLAWLRVDMTCSDKEIIKAFSGWLERARQSTNALQTKQKRRTYKLKQFSSASMRRWYENKVLEYLDLVAWNSLKGNKLTSKIIGDILFPNPNDIRDSTSIVNDTVKPLVNELTSKDTLDRMFKVAADESRKKTS